jgi:hypothetical protein
MSDSDPDWIRHAFKRHITVVPRTPFFVLEKVSFYFMILKTKSLNLLRLLYVFSDWKKTCMDLDPYTDPVLFTGPDP